MDYRARSPAVRAPLQGRRRVRLKRLPGLFMVLVLAVGLLLSLLNPATLEPLRGESLLNGAWAAAYQARFEEKLALREAALTTWGGLSYLLFDEGRKGLLIGGDDWLFSTEEFASFKNAAAQTRSNLEFIEHARDALAARGIDLVVAVVPAKARVYEERLGRYDLPDYTRQRYAALRSALLERGLVAPDLLSALLEAKSEEAVFLRTDTHWTPFGAQVAAREVASAVRARPFKGWGETAFTTSSRGVEAYRGDLLAFLPLGYVTDLGPEPDRLERFETTAQGNGANDLFGEVTIPVTLVGTSYSADERWNFSGALREALGADVLNVAEEGQGPFLPMARYLASETLRNTVPELVVWELPERYIAVPYDLEGEDLP